MENTLVLTFQNKNALTVLKSFFCFVKIFSQNLQFKKKIRGGRKKILGQIWEARGELHRVTMPGMLYL